MKDVVKCRGCGVKMIWTGFHGDWCAVCMPRDLTIKKVK